MLRLVIPLVGLAIGSLVSVSGQSLSTVPFDREGVTKQLDNQHVVVWKGLVGIKSRPTPLHEHIFDLVAVFLDDGGFGKVTLPDGTVRQAEKPTRRGGVIFQPKGVIHTEEQLVDGIRGVAIELKDISTVPPLIPPPSVAKSFPREGATVLLENDRVAVFDYQWKPGQVVPTSFRSRDAVVVALESGEIRYTTADGKSRLTRYAFGDVGFSSRGESVQEEATGGTPRLIVIELK